MIPKTIADQLTRHLGRLRAFDTEVERCRQLERLVGASGRYEYEYRVAHEVELVAPSLAWLARFEPLAHSQGVDLDALYAAHGGKPEVLPWSFEAQQWLQMDGGR